MVWNDRGTTLTEALVTIGIAGIVASLGAMGVSRHYLDLTKAGQQLLNELREVRMEATRRGVHYRLALTSESYRAERMVDQDGDGVWEGDALPPIQQIALPSSLSLAVENAQAGTIVEFNSRGMVVGEQGEIQDRVIEIVLSDHRDDRTVKVRVWPSGQIEVKREGVPAP
jgi:Tfp pilus assembly protein FimT